MQYQVELKKSGRTFTVEADETVLEAAIRQGVQLPYGCKNGACGSCKGKVLQGWIEHGDHSQSALSALDETAGATLLCCAHPKSNVLIDVREIQGGGDIPVRKVPCRIQTITYPSNDVAILQLQLPASERFQFLAGQYLEFLLKDNKRRAYSIASAPHQEGPIELHIRHLPGGLFTDPLFGQGADGKSIKEKDILRFEGPQGSFFLREDTQKPIIFLASGTGFAPIKSILLHMREKKIDREIYFYWGGRRPKDLYMDTLCQEFASTLPRFHYIPVISDALPEDHWTGRTGFVHRAVMADFPDLSAFQVYACGAPIVIQSAQTDFVKQCGLPGDEFYADSFTSEADLVHA
ncbi:MULTISPECIES: CDP-6-deoxy-delta-3,4-glucoseen reductase [unclassified Polynucleobacter]|uniref:CDP-6-deoxy-delta-3,4-glucoseen reductase n=1 Tax=unclassified Polynucleobacter TaxID=2640945 RepID=UPI0025744819|nr:MULTISPECIES: CDP-6-deoxy-delta-3,4-glucoseen reductase [unclassified Polynucleobacter]BEI43249.1 CDP-6-deoxy-delta-3,4-glucoseen reductase [Polynucleobacter sp. HIN10]BEI45025.1 CDP-6-deoxy-delta-3,4-glucoseen reductase [Polynucleobacter sp. HIN11]